MPTQTQFVAFLRGINVGGHKKVPMADLRMYLEAEGFKNVKTLLASGNVIFDAPEADKEVLTTKIKAVLGQKFGFEIPVILRRATDIASLVEQNPFKHIEVTPSTRLYVSFLAEKPNNILKIPYQSPELDFKIIKVTDTEVFSVLTLIIAGQTTNSMCILEKEFGKLITTRNWNTIVKLVK